MNQILPPAIQSGLNGLVSDLAKLLVALPENEASAVLITIKSTLEEINAHSGLKANRAMDPSDVGAPAGAPKPVPVPLEILSEAMATINEEELLKEIHEIRSGKGRKLEDFVQELQKAAHLANESIDS
jgi:hypothetical protein